MITTPNIVNEHLDAVRDLCRKHHVARLELFGSAANGQFDELHSDLDFLIEFEALSPAARAEAYFGILAELQDLFRRDIDLVEAAAVTNPYFKRTLDAGRTVLYAT
jgi:predicted nucleotidyltransferase